MPERATDAEVHSLAENAMEEAAASEVEQESRSRAADSGVRSTLTSRK